MPQLRRALTLVLRLGFAALLLYASISKWGAPRAFAEDLANYRLLPAALVPAAAVGMLGFEAVLGLCLLVGVLRREAALLNAILMAVFTAAVGSALLRGLRIDCGCFGAGGSEATLGTLLRDVAFFAGAAALCHLTFRGEDGGARSRVILPGA